MGNCHARVNARVSEMLRGAQVPLCQVAPDLAQRCERAELRRVAQAGFAVDREECGAGNCCVGAPVFSADGPVTEALAIMTTIARFSTEEPRFIAVTLDIARAASFAMGADPTRSMRQIDVSSDAGPAPNGRLAHRGADTPRKRSRPAAR